MSILNIAFSLLEKVRCEEGKKRGNCTDCQSLLLAEINDTDQITKIIKFVSSVKSINK